MERTFLYAVPAKFKCPACGLRVKRGKLRAEYDRDIDRVCINAVPAECARCGHSLLRGGGAAGNQKAIEKLTYGMRARMAELGLINVVDN